MLHKWKNTLEEAYIHLHIELVSELNICIQLKKWGGGKRGTEYLSRPGSHTVPNTTLGGCMQALPCCESGKDLYKRKVKLQEARKCMNI